jgi:hypothetical protein
LDGGFHPAIEHLGETGEFRDILDGKSGFAKHFCGAARGKNFYTILGNPPGKFENACFV